jgi:hypothetical protein
VPPVPRSDADPGTAGTADCLLRFLVSPRPDMQLAIAGAVGCMRAGIEALPALADIAGTLGGSCLGHIIAGDPKLSAGS